MSGRANTVAHRRKQALAFIRTAGGWVTAKALTEFLGVDVTQVSRALLGAVSDGTIERQHVQGGSGGSKLSWRLAERRTEPPVFSIDWPPGFKSIFDSVSLPPYEARLR